MLTAEVLLGLALEAVVVPGTTSAAMENPVSKTLSILEGNKCVNVASAIAFEGGMKTRAHETDWIDVGQI